MINTAPQGSNGVNVREKYFNTINLAMEEVGVHVPGGATCGFSFFFIVVLPFGLFLLIVYC